MFLAALFAVTIAMVMAGVLCFAILRAPEGHEDQSGFHQEPTVAKTGALLGDHRTTVARGASLLSEH